MQNDDPFSRLINIFGGIAANSQSPVIGIGKVLSTDPLKIEYNGIILEKEELWINDYLWIDHERTAKGHIVSGTQPAGHHSHTHAIDNPYTDTIITTDTDLKPGFYVAIMPMRDSIDGSKQQYIVLCHIRRLDDQYI